MTAVDRRVLAGVVALGIAAALVYYLYWLVAGLMHHEVTFQGKPTSYWQQELHSKGDVEIERARKELTGGNTRAIPILLALLEKADDPFVQAVALDCLGEIGPPSKNAIGEIEVFIDSNDRALRRAALLAIARIGYCSLSAQLRVRSILADTTTQDRYDAALVLVRVDLNSNGESLRILLAGLRDVDYNVKIQAANCLGESQLCTGEITTALQDAMLDSDGKVRSAAAVALLKVSKDYDTVLPVLVKCLKDSNVGVREDAAHALAKIPSLPPYALDALTTALNDPFSGVRDAAAAALKRQ